MPFNFSFFPVSVVCSRKPIICGKKRAAIMGSVPALSGREQLFEQLPVAVKNKYLRFMLTGKAPDIPIIVKSVPVGRKKSGIIDHSYFDQEHFGTLILIRYKGITPCPGNIGVDIRVVPGS